MGFTAGRAIAGAGIVAGLLGLGLAVIESSDADFRFAYADDGTAFAFLVVLLAFASYLPAEVGTPAAGAAAGAAVFGFCMFFPAVFGFGHLGDLGSGAWLGMCTVLIPIGGVLMSAAEWKAGASTGPRPAAAGASPALLAALGGLVLVLVGIWLPAEGDTSYWNASASGHALGILMLVAVLLSAVLIAAVVLSGLPAARHAALIVAAATFGLVEVELIGNAFEEFDDLGSGAWLGACGGLLLLLGAAALYRAAVPREGGRSGLGARVERPAARRQLRQKVGFAVMSTTISARSAVSKRKT